MNVAENIIKKDRQKIIEWLNADDELAQEFGLMEKIRKLELEQKQEQDRPDAI